MTWYICTVNIKVVSIFVVLNRYLQESLLEFVMNLIYGVFHDLRA
jgi:hypothetical protein